MIYSKYTIFDVWAIFFTSYLECKLLRVQAMYIQYHNLQRMLIIYIFKIQTFKKTYIFMYIQRTQTFYKYTIFCILVVQNFSIKLHNSLYSIYTIFLRMSQFFILNVWKFSKNIRILYIYTIFYM